mmetsp:Transcript_3931/g.9477  ORF Transcript_3931/g.9477 Transcript_3931/m.9477 type:complete len:223 (+) Transcript_3931:191-859(+)
MKAFHSFGIVVNGFQRIVMNDSRKRQQLPYGIDSPPCFSRSIYCLEKVDRSTSIVLFRDGLVHCSHHPFFSLQSIRHESHCFEDQSAAGSQDTIHITSAVVFVVELFHRRSILVRRIQLVEPCFHIPKQKQISGAALFVAPGIRHGGQHVAVSSPSTIGTVPSTPLPRQCHDQLDLFQVCCFGARHQCIDQGRSFLPRRILSPANGGAIVARPGSVSPVPLR